MTEFFIATSPHAKEDQTHSRRTVKPAYGLHRAVAGLMSKIVDEPIVMLQPHVRSGGGFVWRDREHRIVQVGGRWAQRGRWWCGEGVRTYIRVTTHENIALDLCYDELGQHWTVAELMD